MVTEARKAYDRAKEQIGEKGLILPAHIFLRLSTKATPEEQEKYRYYYEKLDSGKATHRVSLRGLPKL